MFEYVPFQCHFILYHLFAYQSYLIFIEANLEKDKKGSVDDVFGQKEEQTFREIMDNKEVQS